MGVKSLTGESKSVHNYCFRAGRDMGEVWGRLLSCLGVDKGDYYTQDSLFHQQCYAYRDDITAPKSVTQVTFMRKEPNTGTWITQEGEQISLYDLQQMSCDRQAEIIRDFELSKAIELVLENDKKPQEDSDVVEGALSRFLGRLEGMNAEALQNIHLNDLKCSPRYILFTEADFCHLTIKQMGGLTFSEWKFLQKQAGAWKKEGFEGPVLDTPFLQLPQIPADKLDAHIDQIPCYLLEAVSDAQICKLQNLGRLNGEGVEHLLTPSDRVRRLSSSQIESMLPSMRTCHVEEIPRDIWSQLDFSNCSEEQLNHTIFPNTLQKTKDRFALLTPEQVACIRPRLYAERWLGFVSPQAQKEPEFVCVSSRV